MTTISDAAPPAATKRTIMPFRIFRMSPFRGGRA